MPYYTIELDWAVDTTDLRITSCWVRRWEFKTILDVCSDTAADTKCEFTVRRCLMWWSVSR